ncbi:MAG TPA: nicotinate phosphoribosyltransferase [Blastocatellia bacterium]|nr:nicotinate phosphoribosyltransferase [Blastocatellia bacterium]
MIQRALSLCTDLYELTMAAAYFDNGLHHRGIFELFVRSLPTGRAYLISAGLEQVLAYLRDLRFTGEQIDYLRDHPAFKHVSREFFHYLAAFRFTGDVWAVPEGTAVFASEPLVRVDAPIIEAQIIETYLLATINFQTSIASKAGRVVTAAQGRSVIEFGTRRAHGSEAGLLSARAAFIGGCDGTSNVEAGYMFGIPTFGTLAHSFVMAFDKEDDAFRAFLRVFPDTATILVDTYDTIAAVTRLARDFGPGIPAVRLDSGDLLRLSKEVRQILDDAGMGNTRIFASGDLDEYRIEELLARGARLDAFGVGTQLSTSYDAPALGGVYKLVAQTADGKTTTRIKLSPEKATFPGPRQIWRLINEDGNYVEDVIAMAAEAAPASGIHSPKPLIELVMKSGLAVDELPVAETVDKPRQPRDRFSRLEAARSRAAQELKRLPPDLLKLDSEPNYPIRISAELEREQERLRSQIEASGR